MWFLIVVAIIIGIGIVISLVLAIPFDADIDLDIHGKPGLKVRMKWLFGLVSFDTSEKKGQQVKTKKPDRAREKPSKPRRKAGFGETWLQFNMAIEILRTKGLVTEIKRLIIRLFRCFNVKKLESNFTIGLFDPADTGFLFGIIAAVTLPFGHPLTGNFKLQPSYDGPTFEGDAHAVIRVQPISLFAPVVLFIFSPPVLKVVWIVIATQWRKRRSPQRAPSPSMA